jgi:heterodisulfide reductase subunit C
MSKRKNKKKKRESEEKKKDESVIKTPEDKKEERKVFYENTKEVEVGEEDNNLEKKEDWSGLGNDEKEEDNVNSSVDQQKLQADNLIQEASEILDNCVKCGLCKSLCPIFKIIREEEFSPRGHSILLQNKIIEESMFKCNLCRACEEKCPLNLKICDAILKAREALNLRGLETEANKEMIKNIRETGNPFPKDKDNKDGKLYCC